MCIKPVQHLGGRGWRWGLVLDYACEVPAGLFAAAAC